MRDKKNNLRWAAGAAVIVLAAFLVSKYFYQLMLIRGDSMNPSYHNMQFTLLDKYHRDYTYGNVIAFRCEGLGEILVKRIAAVPGDSVVIREGRLYVNAQISAVYPNEVFEYAGIAEEEIRLAEGQFFVIGDNTARSRDSRDERVGIVDESSVVGKISFD